MPITVGHVYQDDRHDPSGGLDCQIGRGWADYGGQAQFIGPDVDHAVRWENSGEATLVEVRSVGVASRINRWTAAEQRMGKSGAAVVLQRTQLQLCGGDVEPIAGPRNNGGIGGADQVEPA